MTIDNCSNTFNIVCQAPVAVAIYVLACECVCEVDLFSPIIMAIGSQAAPKSMQHMCHCGWGAASEKARENANSSCGRCCQQLMSLSSFWNLIKLYTSKQMTVCSRCRCRRQRRCQLFAAVCICVCECKCVDMCACHMAAK